MIVDISYMCVYYYRMLDGTSVLELVSTYREGMTPWTAETIYWCVFGGLVVYMLAFHICAITALYLRRPRYFRLLANIAALGVLAISLLAYINKFNLISFFLHVLVYIYAWFMQGL